MTADLTGTYLTLEDGRPAVRFSRVYDHPVDRVWQFVTGAGEPERWFPSRAEIELRPGGTITFSGDPHMEDSTGRVLTVDPPHHLAFEWGGDELRFDLEEVGAKSTRFTLTDVLGAQDSAARNGVGWEGVPGRAGRPGARRRDRRSARRRRRSPRKDLYAAYVAAGMPSGAPVPGVD